MNGLFASLITREYFADMRMFDRVICGCLSAATSANYPLQHRRSAHPHFTPGLLWGRCRAPVGPVAYSAKPGTYYAKQLHKLFAQTPSKMHYC